MDGPINYMMWGDWSERSVEEKIIKASRYFHEKYGRAPTHVILPPPSTTLAIAGLTISFDDRVLPGNLWLG